MGTGEMTAVITELKLGHERQNGHLLLHDDQIAEMRSEIRWLVRGSYGILAATIIQLAILIIQR